MTRWSVAVLCIHSLIINVDIARFELTLHGFLSCLNIHVITGGTERTDDALLTGKVTWSVKTSNHVDIGIYLTNNLATIEKTLRSINIIELSNRTQQADPPINHEKAPKL